MRLLRYDFTGLNMLIDRVIVTDEEVEIRYVVPTRPDGPHVPFRHLRTDYRNRLGRRQRPIGHG
jgi:site-specific DNA recombinase